LPAGTASRGWQQRNSSGFGSAANTGIGALASFGDYLYAGTWNEDNGAELWRMNETYGWSDFTPAWSGDNVEVASTQALGSYLYIGTGNMAGGEIWRTNGATSGQVAAAGLGDANNYSFDCLAVFKNTIYAATGNVPPDIGGSGNGVEIWRSGTGNPGSWSQANDDGFGAGPTWLGVTMDVFEGYLYAGLGRVTAGGGSLAELWRTANGLDWTAVFTDGLGVANNGYVSGMAVFEDDFYLTLRNVVDGAQVWRSGNGLDWTKVADGGFGLGASGGRSSGLIPHDGLLYLALSRFSPGAEIWATRDGANWWIVAGGGWDDANNMFAANFDKALAVYQDALYVGTVNSVEGAELWQRLRELFLPIVSR
jgi:hypothetical protein